MNTPIPFAKMHGCGNDFALIDNRVLGVRPEDMARWARAICARGFGVGADGLIFLEDAPDDPTLDYRWHFYNSDGSRAEMCGNASRCAARLAVELGLAGPEHVLGTDAGPVRAKVLEGSQVKVQLTKPAGLELGFEINVLGREVVASFVNTGVPHVVVLVEGEPSDLPGRLEDLDVAAWGRAIRTHERFAPAGTNVNFARVNDRNTLDLRTYERGVEAETLACGTGAAASVVAAHGKGLCGPEVAVRTTGNEILTISLEHDMVFLQGDATKVFAGELFPQALGL